MSMSRNNNKIKEQNQITLQRRGTGIRFLDQKKSAGGYTLFTPQTSNGAVYLIDIEGTVVHSWDMPVRPGRDAVLLKNGNLGYNGSHKISLNLYPAWNLWHGGAFFEATPGGKIVWTYEDPRHHHDAQWLENGNLLYTVAHTMPAHFATRVRGGEPSKDVEVENDHIIQSDIVVEVNRKGDIVWEWRIWEHLDPFDFPIQPIFDRHHWPLINGLSVTSGGLILMSLRVTSGILAVYKDSGKIAWYIGPDIVSQQHTPQEVSNGNILVFDNGNMRKGIASPYSRILELEQKTGKIVWQYSDSCLPCFFSPYMGGAQRLDNGNTLVCESAFGRLFEITPEGSVVWEYIIPFFGQYPACVRKYIDGYHNSTFRAHRYPACAIPWL